jgi:hypothetical protein
VTNEEGPETMGTVEHPVEVRLRIALAVWGDPVIARALVLLLRSSAYKASFLSTSSLEKPGALEDVRLVLLAPAPGLSIQDRESQLASLRVMSRAAKIPVLELVETSKEKPEGPAREASWHILPWPCGIEELERQIEAVLCTDHKVESIAGEP